VYTLDILLNNWARNQFVRWRAPSAVVESYNSGTGAITVDSNAFSTDDLSFFLEDMHIYITSKNGASRDASYRAITDITGAVITHGGGPFSGVVAGDIVRIAGYQFPASSDVPIPGYSGRVWGYFANDGDLDGDDADIWG
jgi:hypothetical protein